MLKLLKAATLGFIVILSQASTTEACLWWLNPFNTCGYDPCCSPCYTPCCNPVMPLCNPCMGMQTPAVPFPAGPAYMPSTGCGCTSGYGVTTPYPLSGSVYPGTTNYPGSTTMGVPSNGIQMQQGSPQQVIMPPTWIETPQSTVPPGNIELPPSAESLESTQTDWQIVKPRGTASDDSEDTAFQNVTLKKDIESGVSVKQKRRFRAPSAVKVWQHLSTGR